ncbi:hypothetical protein ASG89_33675 [Paenibacillus sp. Soil766]|uniref:hypothetical protein n=1 Tax=Paenibacillus sp. Soil766 TaxID=1736404 RepID=UPI0007105BCE|nr:hypothetical protein [Paenibacillus sp. Soil766]KRE92116.1 hypothetical protein ASG89_33675 [Paenibacillus sp. Soil766]
MENIVYDNHFNGNEWFVIGVIVFSLAPIWFFPRRFSPTQTTFNMLISVTYALILDHTIGVPPFDLYDWGDQSKYQFFDMFFYIMYAPFGYWFIYWYERMRMYEIMTITYILIWAGVSVGFEWMGVKIGAFHYKHGYQLFYSFPIYLFLMSIHLMMYRMAFAWDRWQRKESICQTKKVVEQE